MYGRGNSERARNQVVEEEADECQFWIDLLRERSVLDATRLSLLRDEAGEIVAMTVSSIKTARRAPRSTPHSAFRTPHSAPQCS